MKFRYLSTLLMSSLLLSCNYLDFDETSGLKTKEDMYKYFGTTENMLNNVYSYMPQDLGSMEHAMRDCGSDDAEFGLTSAVVQRFNNGGWSSIKTLDDSWTLYNGVRAANSFLKEIESVDFSRYQYEPAYKNWMKKLKFFPFEARVLRAHYFFELARRYGDIAMPLEVLDKGTANTIAKTKFADVINFIVSECDEAAKVLPLTYENEPDKQIGRVTKGFALAVKTKALLYAASPLHNPTGDKELWKKAASAAQEIIDLNFYVLDPNGAANNIASKEAVLLRMNDDNNDFELYNFPIRFTEGNRSESPAAANYPSQNLVDAFETINGYSITLADEGWETEDPDFDVASPYANRDPRFAKTILANGMNFKNSTIETFIGGKDDAEVSMGGTPTGYFLRKYIQETTSFVPDQTVSAKHHWVIYRYAETLLTYAEAMANAFPENMEYTDDVYKHSALWAINQVRGNANMPSVENCPQEEFMARLRNEWRVEFAFEDHRFWDVRRWKIGDSTQRELYGVKIEREDSGFKYSKTLYETRIWKDCMYLYPIPQDEIFKNSNLNPQNTGW